MTTAEPVFSTALVMNDLFEYILTSLIFGLLNCWDITSEGDVVPTVMNEAINNSLGMYFFNFDFLMFSRDLIHHTSVI